MKHTGIIFFCLMALNLISYSPVNAQKVTLAPEYELPYPGILPDHPFYILKVVRDRIVIFFTKKPQDKVSLYILLADKRLAMGEKLVEKKKEKQAAETISKGEKYLLRAVDVLWMMKSKNTNPDVGLVNKIATSVAKHKEVVAKLSSRVGLEAQSSMGLSLQLAEDVGRQLHQFKKQENIGM